MKLLRRTLITLLALAPLSLAWASSKEPFTQERFDQLQSAGEVVLIDVYATWCPTCAKQQAVLEAYKKANPDKNLHTLVVDYDKQKDVVKAFRAPRQSTLLLFKGAKQHWFSVAETREQVIAEALDKTFSYNYQAK